MNERQEWHAITVTSPPEGADWISHLMFELGSVGNLEEDAPDPLFVAMRGYFPAELGPSSAIIQQIGELIRKRGIEPLSIYGVTIKLQNWAENAGQMFSPIKITGDLTVVNPWDKYKPSPGEDVVVINPGMAFGTGLHATTQLAARLIMEAAEICCHSRPVSGHGAGSSGNPVITTNPSSLPAGRNDISMCDVGCGSGILSIIAAKKGVGRITAVEIDADAAASANENIARNGFADTIRVLDKICKAGGRFDIVAANILFATIIELKPDLLRLARRGGFLILSGITKEEDERFMAANKNLELVKKAEQDGWMGYMYRAF